MTDVPHPPIVSRHQWLAERKKLLEAEKTLTRQFDAVNAQRRRLPMVKLEKRYEFDGPGGKLRLVDLFDGRRQLVVYHFMFDPSWDQGCPGCTSLVDSLSNLKLLSERDTSFALVSRAPFAKLEKYKAEKHWPWMWVSSLESDFNYDFQVTLDPAVVPLEYNFREAAESEAQPNPGAGPQRGERHGLSVFFRLDDDVFHTYSTYARGCEPLVDGYQLLDRTPYGRQEDFEDSPAGWRQRPTYGPPAD